MLKKIASIAGAAAMLAATASPVFAADVPNSYANSGNNSQTGLTNWAETGFAGAYSNKGFSQAISGVNTQYGWTNGVETGVSSAKVTARGFMGGSTKAVAVSGANEQYSMFGSNYANTGSSFAKVNASYVFVGPVSTSAVSGQNEQVGHINTTVTGNAGAFTTVNGFAPSATSTADTGFNTQTGLGAHNSITTGWAVVNTNWH